MGTKLSKSPAGNQWSGHPCNAISPTFNNINTHMHTYCTNTTLEMQNIFLHLTSAPHTHTHWELRHTLRHHYYSAFRAYYLHPITGRQSFVLPLSCQASYLTKTGQMRHSTNGWIIQIFCYVSHSCLYLEDIYCNIYLMDTFAAFFVCIVFFYLHLRILFLIGCKKLPFTFLFF